MLIDAENAPFGASQMCLVGGAVFFILVVIPLVWGFPMVLLFPGVTYWAAVGVVFCLMAFKLLIQVIEGIVGDQG